MDYRFVCLLLTFALACVTILHSANAIVGRDVVLTPKQGLQLNGKRIYYEEDSNTKTNQNQTLLRPWERTLKHVTYVTLFTNAAADAVAGNISKLKAYDDFLYSPYIPQRRESDTRFGDIVTLASGRLEQSNNNTFRFVEGVCGYDCEAERVWALWQVQKIRHRDANRKFRYEMKFSVSPLRTENTGNIKRKAELESTGNNGKRSISQTFVQRDDDYPKTFGKIINENDALFADRRFDNYEGRNFKPAHLDQYRQEATPIPQSTFMHGIFQPHPNTQQHSHPQAHPHVHPHPHPHPNLYPHQSAHAHLPPLPEKLNIGEYIKEYPPRSSAKIEHFPNILKSVSRNYYPTPTTYRPNYRETKFPRPELIYTPPTNQHEPMKFPNSQEVAGSIGGGDDGVNKLTTPVVTHHFHHHFYMPTTMNIENGLGSAEQPLKTVTHAYKSVTVEATAPTYNNNHYNGRMKVSFQQEGAKQTPTTLNYPVSSYAETEVHREHLVQVTPVPPLKRPQIYQMYQIPVDSKVPLIIYPAPVVEEEQAALNTNNKPFIQSEPMDEDSIRYSEPDPLYLNLAHNPPIDVQSYELPPPQLEAPKTSRYVSDAGRHTNTISGRKSAKPDSITAQLPPPDEDEDVSIPYGDVTQETRKTKHDLEQKPSQKDLQISAKKKQKTKFTPSTAAHSKNTGSGRRISSTSSKAGIDTSSKAPDTTTLNPTTTTTTAPTTITTTTTTEELTSSNQLETIKTAACSSLQTTTTPATKNSLHSVTTAMPSTTAVDAGSLSLKNNKHNFISTSTAVTPSLRGIGRYRLKHVRPVTRRTTAGTTTTTTSTEQPAPKWKPRRKHSPNSAERTAAINETTTQMHTTTTTATTIKPQTQTQTQIQANDGEEKTISQSASESQMEEKLLPTVATTTNHPIVGDDNSMPLTTPDVFEVLTQKSVSKSVSIKIGDNGKEIPLLIDDSDYGENVVKMDE